MDPSQERERPVEELPTRDLVGDLLEEAERLFREEIRLASGQLRDGARRAAGASVIASAGGVLGAVGLLVLVLDAVYLLAYLIPLWVSALVIGGGVATIGGLLAWGAVRQLSQALSMPRQVVEKVKEDARWTREKIHESRSRTPASA